MPMPPIARPFARGIAALIVIAATGRAAQAQGSPGDVGQRAAAQPPTDSKWRLTFRGGGTLPGGASSGVSALPLPGIPINLINGLGTHDVPSWFFGDGASILNSTVAPIGHALTPIDGLLTSPSIRRQRGAAFGLSISRSLSPRYRLDFAVDGSLTAPTFTPAARSTLEASRASFDDAFSALFQIHPGAFTNTAVTATSSVHEGDRMEWLVSGAIDVTLHRTARSEWHATVGAGVVVDPGTGASATLLGHYTFVATPFLPAYDETDAVTISSKRTTRPLVLIGGGWSHDLSRRWGLAADARVTLSGVGETTSVATTPKAALQSPGQGLILIISQTPSVVFSNVASPPSSLSTRLSSFTTFVATGVQVRAELTAGIFLRF
jgi:hypothetical protein